MCQRKAWTKQEDQLLINIMSENGSTDTGRKMKWNDIAAKISELSHTKNRKGKQCRQRQFWVYDRWFNQLHPSINREAEWTQAQQALLFQLQAEHGNKWAKIAKQLSGRSDNNIKNYFYSTLRKAIRRVNNYVTFHKHQAIYKNIKAFQPNTLNKILAVAQNKADRKIIVGKQSANQLAKDIRDALIQIQMNHSQAEFTQKDDFMKELVGKILDFNRVCKRRKSKKKQQSSCDNIEKEDSFQQPLENSINNSIYPLHNKSYAFNTITSFQANDNQLRENKKPLRCSYNQAEEKEALGVKQVESEPIVLSKNVRQPIIPARQNSNCFSQSSQNINKSIDRTKESQSLKQSKTIINEQLPQNSTSNLNFIPFVHQNYFPGSAFMPTSFYSRPFFGFTTSSNPQTGFANFNMNWSQQYDCKQGPNSSLLKNLQNIIQQAKCTKEPAYQQTMHQ